MRASAQVFDVPPQGITKIVLSTNISETSVTINDITCVIDCGTHKEMQYDSSSGMSCLRQVRVAKANAAYCERMVCIVFHCVPLWCDTRG